MYCFPGESGVLLSPKSAAWAPQGWEGMGVGEGAGSTWSFRLRPVCSFPAVSPMSSWEWREARGQGLPAHSPVGSAQEGCCSLPSQACCPPFYPRTPSPAQVSAISAESCCSESCPHSDSDEGNRMVVLILKVASVRRRVEAEGGVGTFRRRSLAVWISSSLGFSLKVPWAHSLATCSRWQQPRGLGGQTSAAKSTLTLVPPP